MSTSIHGTIYQITCPSKPKIWPYIGSTKQSLNERLSKHRYDLKRYLLGKFNFLSSFHLMKEEAKGNSLKISMIEEGEYESETDLRRKEGKLIKRSKCQNKKKGKKFHKKLYEVRDGKVKRKRKINHKNLH
jgi:hypothetical protein